MHRVFLPNLQLNENEVILTDKTECHHIYSVLNFKPGHSVELINGEGLLAQAEIQALSRSRVDFKIQSIQQQSVLNPRIILACALPKKSKFEWIIEKVTELGVDEIIPMMTQRSEVVISNSKLEKKQQRFQTVAVNAAKQCKRVFLPKIHSPKSFDEVLDESRGKHQMIIPHLIGERETLHQISFKSQSFLIFIGPEGDFSPEEVDQALSAEAQAVSLGSNVLKVETAAMFCVGFFSALRSKY